MATKSLALDAISAAVALAPVQGITKPYDVAVRVLAELERAGLRVVRAPTLTVSP